MNKKRRLRLYSKSTLWALYGLLLFSAQPAFSAPKILLHQDVNVAELDSSYLKQIFAMQIRKWPDNQAIIVYTLPGTSDLHHRFVLERLKIHSHQLDRIWNRMLFTGTGKAPTVVRSEEEMLRAIRETPGAIGYVSESYQVGEARVVEEVQP